MTVISAATMTPILTRETAPPVPHRSVAVTKHMAAAILDLNNSPVLSDFELLKL